jgi:hypothetical protein
MMKNIFTIWAFLMLVSIPSYGQSNSVGIQIFHSSDVGNGLSHATPSIGGGVSFQHNYESNLFVKTGLKLISVDYIYNLSRSKHMNAYRIPMNLGKRFGNDFSFAELAIGPQISYYSNYIDYVLEGDDFQMDDNKGDRRSFCFGLNYNVNIGTSLNKDYELAIGLHGSSDIVNIKALSNNASNTINSKAIYFEISRKF